MTCAWEGKDMSGLTVTALRALTDNYIYVIRRPHDDLCAVVDPSQAAPVLEELRRRPGHLAAMFLTHHHHDHVGGLKELLEHLGPIPVYGSRVDQARVAEISVPLDDEARVVCAGEAGVAMAIPGHTRGHLAYHFPGSGHLFCGDTLFGAGCGRVFEGTPEQMFRSLERLANLPETTRVWCGHEYTKANLRFARTVDPDNAALTERDSRCVPPTVPLDLALEKRTNPFLRCAQPALQEATGRTDPVAVFAELRRRKDHFA